MKKNHTVPFSEKLDKLIQKNGIKKIDLAKELGISKSAVSNYLSGVSTPKIGTLRKIAAYFGVSFEDLINVETEDETIFSLNESDKYICSIPLFHNVLNSEGVIYKAENFIGNITAPIFLPENSECYAVIVRDDLMQEDGIICGSLVVFDAESSPSSGELVAVIDRNARRITIRRILYDGDNIKLCYADNFDEYNSSIFVILGKILFATFNPNKAK